MPKLTQESIQKRINVVVSALKADPEATNSDISKKLKEVTGLGSTSTFINNCRESFKKIQGKLAGGTKPLGEPSEAVEAKDAAPAAAADKKHSRRRSKAEGKAAQTRIQKKAYRGTKALARAVKTVPGHTTVDETHDGPEDMSEAFKQLRAIFDTHPNLLLLTASRRDDGSVQARSEARSIARLTVEL